jgi:hypothetical protein
MNLGFRRLLDTMNKRFDDFIPFVEAARRDRITASDAYMAIVRRLERLERKAA